MHPPTRTSTAVLCHGHVQLVSPTLGPSSGACSQHQSTVSLYTPRGALAPAPTANSVLQRYNEMGTSPRVHRGNTRSGGGGIRCIDRGGRCVRPGEATRRGREGVCGGWTLRMRVSSSRREGRTSSDRNGTIEQTDSDGCRDRCAVAATATCRTTSTASRCATSPPPTPPRVPHATPHSSYPHARGPAGGWVALTGSGPPSALSSTAYARCVSHPNPLAPLRSMPSCGSLGRGGGGWVHARRETSANQRGRHRSTKT
jgi:hypothetical protein